MKKRILAVIIVLSTLLGMVVPVSAAVVNMTIVGSSFESDMHSVISGSTVSTDVISDPEGTHGNILKITANQNNSGWTGVVGFALKDESGNLITRSLLESSGTIMWSVDVRAEDVDAIKNGCIYFREGKSFPPSEGFCTLRSNFSDLASDVWYTLEGTISAEYMDWIGPETNGQPIYFLIRPNFEKNGQTMYIDNMFVRFGKVQKPTVGNVPVSTVRVSSNQITLGIGKTAKISASVWPVNASDKRIVWSSNNPSVAKVDSNGKVTGCSLGTATIYARSVNGKTARCIITVTEQINYNDFCYSFINSSDAFGYGESYLIPPERYMQMGWTWSKANKKVNKQKDNGETWDGNCFGMSNSSILFYKNVLQEESYDQNVSVPKEFDEPKFNTKLRQMIELLQVSYYHSKLDSKAFSAKDIAKEIRKGNPVSLFLNGRKVSTGGIIGHEVVIYDYELIDNIYVFSIYDCSNFVYELWYIDNNNFKFLYNDESVVWNQLIGYYTFDTLDTLLDEIKKVNSNNASSLFSVRQEPTYTHFFRPAENLTITNSAGKVSSVVDGIMTGEIENARVIPSSYLAENPTYTIILPTDTYTIVGTSDEVVTTAFADDYMSAEVSAKSSTPITISSDLKTISADCAENDEYSIEYTTYDNIFDEMTLSGVATGKVTTVLDGANVSVDGASTITASASVSDSAVSATAEELASTENVTVKCEETDSGTTIQILSTNAELTEKTALPERLQVEAPTYDLESGTYTEGQMLTFTKDEDTIIYYTTDGSIPSADNGIIYSLPIDINKSMTVKAISTKYGYSDSEIVELNYTLPEVDAPQANLESGKYDKVIAVELSTSDVNDEIYYTLDGSNPLENGVLYTVPINISEDTYLLAYTLRNGCVSEICEYDYEVTPVYPIHFSNSITNQDGEIITTDNVGELSKVRLTVANLHGSEQTGTFLVAFYDEREHLICIETKEATISGDDGYVEIDVRKKIPSACKVKAFCWELPGMEPLSETMEQSIVSE